jgi:hypothetical protein
LCPIINTLISIGSQYGKQSESHSKNVFARHAITIGWDHKGQWLCKMRCDSQERRAFFARIPEALNIQVL